MDNRSAADDNELGSDWDDEDSTLDFTSPRNTNKINLRASLNSALKDDDDDDDISERTNQKPKPKERSTNNQTYDTNDPVQRGSNIIPKQRNNIDGPPHLTSHPVATDNPPYDFKGALTDERKLEDTGQRPGRDKKGNRYDVPPSPHPRPPSTLDNTWDDSDAEERTLRELNATLKKEKKREYDEEVKQRRQEKKDAERAQQFPTSRSEKASRGYSSGWSQRGQPYEGEGSQFDRRQEDIYSSIDARQEVPYTARDVVVDVAHPALKQYDASDDVLPVVFHDEQGARMLYHFKPCNMQAYTVPDTEEEAVMPGVADKAEKAMRRLWLEVFGSLRLVTSIFVIFISEALRYIFHHIFRPITVGVIIGVGDFFLKPLLSLTFSFIVQPLVVFLWNTLTAIRHLMQPIIDMLSGVLSPVAMVLRAFRLFDITYTSSPVRNV